MGVARVHSMLIIQVDGLDAEPAQAAFARRADIGGFAAHPTHGRVGGVAHDAELGRQEGLVSPSLDGSAHQFLIEVWPVHVRRIQQGDPEFQGAVNGVDGFLIVAWAIKLGHAHATQTDG